MSDNTQQIVEEVKNELAEERFIGDKVLVSRRELVAVAAGSATVAGLLGHETGTASAQSGGTGRLGDPTSLEYVGASELGNNGNPVTVKDALDADRGLITNLSDGALWANQFSGSTLSDKISNALTELSNLGGHREIWVGPPADGTTWDWGSQLTIDPTAYPGGVTLRFGTTRISYVNANSPIVADSGGDTDNQEEGRQFRLYGGIWDFTDGTDLVSFVDLVDIHNAIIENCVLRNVLNPNADATAIRVRNNSAYSDALRIRNITVRAGANRFIDFMPASVTGGTGTEAHDHTVIEGCQVRGVKDFGIRFRGSMSACKIHNNNMIHGKDGAVAYVIDAINMQGTTFQSGNAESGGNASTVGYEIGSNFDGTKPPLVLWRAVNEDSVANVLSDPGATGNTIYAVRTDGAGISHVDLSTL